MAISSDDTTWTKINSGTTNNLSSIAYGNGQFVAVGDNGTILTSIADPTGTVFQPNFKANINGFKIAVVNNWLFTKLPNSLSNNQIKIVLFNVSGRRIYSSTVRSQNGILNVPANGFPAGKYFISITDGNNKTLNSSFILTR